MFRLFSATIACSVVLSITTAVIYVASLGHVLGSLQAFHKLQYNAHRYTTEVLIKSGQVGMNFSNEFFHITSDEEWASLQPKVFRLDPESSQDYVVSMHQQLHCLDVFRKAYLSFQPDRPKLSPMLQDEGELCLEQLRQTIMCHADITLEPTIPVLTEDGIIPGSPGIGAIHRCSDWKGLESTVDQYIKHMVHNKAV